MLNVLEGLQKKETSIAVVGLGYVGLPLAVNLAKHFDVIGFDVSESRISELLSGYDKTHEVAEDSLRAVSIKYSADPTVLIQASCIIVAVPTPVNSDTTPDLSLVERASQMVGSNMKVGTIVVYESTVYPGATEEVCVPILEGASGLRLGVDFSVGYSPERINPGDKVHTVDNIVKIVSGSDRETLDVLAFVYGTITCIHRAPSIRVAEAAKVIENAQRDINIAFMNELAQIFSKMGISTHEVLEAAGTKWNFLPFKPGLVGGHCIGVDPYYLTYKAKKFGYEPEVILSGRKINDNMHLFFKDVIEKQLGIVNKKISNSSVVIFGATFKENIPDVRNSRIMLLVKELQKEGAEVYVCDPHASSRDLFEEYGIHLTADVDVSPVDVVLFGVPHDEYKELTSIDLLKYQKQDNQLVCVDLKNIFDKNDMEKAGFIYWSL